MNPTKCTCGAQLLWVETLEGDRIAVDAQQQKAVVAIKGQSSIVDVYVIHAACKKKKVLDSGTTQP